MPDHRTLREPAGAPGQPLVCAPLDALDFVAEKNRQALADAAVTDKAAAARTLKCLEADGYISRRADPHDRRVLRVFLTTKGRRQRALMEQRGRVRESILRDVRGVIEEKSKAGGYNTVLDISAQSANGTPVVIFTTLAGGESDLSDSVAKALAATAPPDSAKTDAPKTEAKDPKKADENKAEKK